MKFLQEVLANVSRLENDKQPTNSDLDIDINDDYQKEQPEEELDIDDEGQEENPEEDKDLDSIANQATEDPDHQGLIRKVNNAHLVYKRKTEEGLYSELWIYNVDTLHHEFDTKKAILAGTDIPTNRTTSPDGSQSYTIWSAGNAEMVLILGLPN